MNTVNKFAFGALLAAIAMTSALAPAQAHVANASASAVRSAVTDARDAAQRLQADQQYLRQMRLIQRSQSR